MARRQHFSDIPALPELLCGRLHFGGFERIRQSRFQGRFPRVSFIGIRLGAQLSQ
ncbi:MAG: hypothetical protein ACREJC_00120 [Tepidisphaeraceae bacterium]